MSTTAMSGSASKPPAMPLWVIGNPENRRYHLYCAAAERLGFARPQIVAYHDLLFGQVTLAERIPPGALVRIESPSENVAVERELVLRGGRLSQASETELQHAWQSADEHGCIAAPQWWFSGYCAVLARIEAELSPLGVRWMNHPAEIPRLFDKSQCQTALAAGGIPTPRLLLSADDLPLLGYEDLRTRLQARQWRRAFVKLRYGSSASGVVALQFHRQQVIAITSVELHQQGDTTRLYNSLHVRRYHREPDIAAIIDELCRYGVQVEEWLPKAGFQGRTFDLRVMVIAGEVRHVVMRTSRQPITNLHLGNQRGNIAEFLDHWNSAAREAAWDSCRRAATIFARSLYAGVDLALLPSLRRHAILEINAFGDLLPGVLSEGEDTYSAELRAAVRTA